MIGQKPPLRPKDVWAIRIYLQNAHAVRDLALFNLAIDSKLRGCDLVSLRVRDVIHGNQVLPRALIVQRKTQRPVQFELTEPTRLAVDAWLEKAALRPEHYLFPSRLSTSPHLSTRQYARMIHRWAGAAGLDPTVYGTHSMRRYVPFVAMSGNLNKRSTHRLSSRLRSDELPPITRHSFLNPTNDSGSREAGLPACSVPAYRRAEMSSRAPVPSLQVSLRDKSEWFPPTHVRATTRSRSDERPLAEGP